MVAVLLHDGLWLWLVCLLASVPLSHGQLAENGGAFDTGQSAPAVVTAAQQRR